MADRQTRYRAELELLAQKFLHLDERYTEEGEIMREMNQAMERSNDAAMECIRSRMYQPNRICDTLAIIHVAEQGLRMIYDPNPDEIQEVPQESWPNLKMYYFIIIARNQRKGQRAPLSLR